MGGRRVGGPVLFINQAIPVDSFWASLGRHEVISEFPGSEVTIALTQGTKDPTVLHSQPQARIVA